MGKARCSTTLTYIKTTPLYKATVDTAKALGISAGNYAKVLQEANLSYPVNWNGTDVCYSVDWVTSGNSRLFRNIDCLASREGFELLAFKHYYIEGVEYPVNQNLIKLMEKRNAKLKQSTRQ